VLNSLQQAYGIRGNSIYTRGLLTANLTSRVSFFGQFLYSQPTTDVTYTELAGGTSSISRAAGFRRTVRHRERLRHPTARLRQCRVEVRATNRFRITESSVPTASTIPASVFSTRRCFRTFRRTLG
jgi:hypothetical protein